MKYICEVLKSLIKCASTGLHSILTWQASSSFYRHSKLLKSCPIAKSIFTQIMLRNQSLEIKGLIQLHYRSLS